jgi:hypothetical protein
MGAISYIALRLIAPFVNTHTVIGILLQSGISGIAGLVAFIALGHYLGLPELNYIISTLRKYARLPWSWR